MIDFSQVRGIWRYDMQDKTEHELRYIDYKKAGGATVCLWKRPLSYPTLGFAVSYPDILPSGFSSMEHQVSWALIDKYGIACNWSMVNNNAATQVKNADGSYTRYMKCPSLYVSTGRNAEQEWVDMPSLKWPNPYGETTLTAYVVRNEQQLMEYPAKFPKPNIPSINGVGVIWRFSDVTTGKIKLYARKKINNITDAALWTPSVTRNYTTYKDWALLLKEHDTDVEVEAGQPLIKLATISTTQQINAKGGIRTIAEMRTNLDDYKAKYDAATGGQFPKSEYPYLRATIAFGPECSGFGIQTSNNIIRWDMMHLTFEVDR